MHQLSAIAISVAVLIFFGVPVVIASLTQAKAIFFSVAGGIFAILATLSLVAHPLDPHIKSAILVFSFSWFAIAPIIWKKILT